MKTILSEIKNFRRLVNITESDDKDVKVVLVGDQLTYELESNDFMDIPGLKDEDMTIDKLLMRLSKENPKPEVDHVFVSIGLNDKFQDKKVIPFLIDALDNIFPNAEINIIKGIVGNDYFYGSEEAEDFKKLEEDILSYYNVFKQNGLTVLGNYPSLDYGFGDTDKSISILKGQMSDSLFQNITNFGQDIEPLSIDEPFIYKDNVDISGDDVTDYDTIYEFLDRFEEIVKSGNRYDVRVRNSFRPDIEQIQMALRFVLPNSDIEITGNYDTDTQEAIYEFQDMMGIEPTGIADQETLEELLFDLKAKSFDDDDLGKYLSELGVIFKREKKELEKFTGSVDSVWKSFTDKIIDNFEGGYWNRDKTKPSSEICTNHPWDDLYENSGETMFGIDRRAGGWDNRPGGKEFFAVIDNEKENAGSMEEFCKTWKYNYDGGSLREELKLRASALMKSDYDSLSQTYFSSEVRSAVESDKRLLFHFAYACWNGSRFFQDFAKDIEDAIEEGKTGDELVEVAIDSRNNEFGGTGWAKNNQKVIDIIKNDSSLKN
jgi:peptidoglycan hydrolase-like protein with peptidoglycan-binding domain